VVPTEWLLPLLLLTLFGVIALLFLPSLLEIKKPKDRGPRRMPETTIQQITESSQMLGSLLAACSQNEQNPQKNRDDEVLGSNGHLIRLFGDREFTSGSEVKESVVVEGALKIADRCSFLRSVKAFGNVTVGNDVFIGENLVAQGDVNVGRGTVVKGAIHAQGSVKLGESVSVGCSVVAGGDVELQENSKVMGIISAHGCIRVVSKPKVDSEPSVLESPVK